MREYQHAQKLMKMYGLLLFHGRKFSLKQLARELDCSKQTVLRLAEQIGSSYAVKLETNKSGRERYFWIKTPYLQPKVSLESEDIQYLVMCADMMQHVLPEGISEKLTDIIAKTTTLLPGKEEKHKALRSISQSQVKGCIDYTPYQDIIETLLSGIRAKRVCEIKYRSPWQTESREYNFAPGKLTTFRDALFADGWLVTDRGTVEKKHVITFAVHRTEEVVLTRRTFDFDSDELQRPNYFGFIDGEPFAVKIRFDSEVAPYVKERTWSEDQQIKEFKNGKIELEFTAQSWVEVIAWVLSFGKHAKVLKPVELKKEVKETISEMKRLYEQ